MKTRDETKGNQHCERKALQEESIIANAARDLFSASLSMQPCCPARPDFYWTGKSSAMQVFFGEALDFSAPTCFSELVGSRCANGSEHREPDNVKPAKHSEPAGSPKPCAGARRKCLSALILATAVMPGRFPSFDHRHLLCPTRRGEAAHPNAACNQICASRAHKRRR
jgi:hypothetical protein